MKAKQLTVHELAALQARLMLTTPRVGDRSEDASMADARPALAELNRLGLVTVDSQTGERGGGAKGAKGDTRRAYVSGFASKHLAAALWAEMDRVSGVLSLRFPHGEHAPLDHERHALEHLPRLSLTYDGGRPATRMPLAAAQRFSSMWSGLLPETRLRRNTEARDAIAGEVVQLFFADMTWGRKEWLFERLLKALKRCKRENLVLRTGTSTGTSTSG